MPETLQDKAKRLGQDAAARAERKRAENRESMPQSTAMLEAFRKAFGGDLPYGKFTEGGKTVQWGTPPEERGETPRELDAADRERLSGVAAQSGGIRPFAEKAGGVADGKPRRKSYKPSKAGG